MKFYRLVFIVIVLGLSSCGNDSGSGDPVFKEPALQKITEEIEKHPENAGLYFERGVMLDRMEMDTLALKDYKKAISLDSTRAEYYSAIGDMLFEHKDIAGSATWLEKALALNPDDKTAHLKLAKMFLYIKEYTKAFAEINTVLRVDVYNPEGYFLKGMIYKDLKDTTRAISSFLTAQQVEPTYKDAIVQLGIMYSMKGDPLALKYYDNAYKLDTLDVFPLYARGVYYQDKGDKEQAKAEYKNAIMHERQYENAYFNLGFIYLEQDSLDKAFRQYDIITKISPENAEAYYYRGICNERMGKKNEAIADYQQALVFDDAYDEPKEALKKLGVKL